MAQSPLSLCMCVISSNCVPTDKKVIDAMINVLDTFKLVNSYAGLKLAVYFVSRLLLTE